jgi:hypothetical protein
MMGNKAIARASRGDGIAIAAVFVLAVACLLYPVISNPVPPLLDYAGHVARIFVLYNLIHGTGFADMYRIHLAVVPNLAVDGIVLGLMELGMSVEAAGRCFLALTLVVLASGVTALHYAAFRRISVWPVLALPFIYQESFFLGFINYLFGVGFALLAAAIWRLQAPRHLGRAGIILFLCAVVLFFSHLLTLLLLFGFVLGFELADLMRSFTGHRRIVWIRLAVAAIAAGLPLVLLSAAPLMADNSPPTWADAMRQLDPVALKLRLEVLLGVARGYAPLLDAASLLGVIAVGVYGLVRGLVRVDVPSLLPVGGLFVIYLVIPDGWFHTSSLPDRLPIVIFLAAMAATDVVAIRRWERIALPLIVAILALARGAAVERAWQSADAAFQPVLAAFQTIPEGSRIYSAIAYSGDFGAITRVPYYELPAYATIYRHAFYPHTFTTPSQNIVLKQPTYERAPMMPRNHRVDRPRPPFDDPYDPALLAFYDYALVVNPAFWPQTPPATLTPVVTGPDYTLFRIERPR